MATVTSILSQHAKTIILLGKRYKELETLQKSLKEKEKELATRVEKSSKESRKAKAAIDYLSGLFKAVNNA